MVKLKRQLFDDEGMMAMPSNMERVAPVPLGKHQHVICAECVNRFFQFRVAIWPA